MKKLQTEKKINKKLMAGIAIKLKDIDDLTRRLEKLEESVTFDLHDAVQMLDKLKDYIILTENDNNEINLLS